MQSTFLQESVNADLRMAVLNFKDFKPQLFLIYNQKYHYVSRSISYLYEFFCARTSGSCSCTLISVKHNALCLCSTCYCFVHYFNCKYLFL